jgi:structure-specific recognition protein 1
MRVVSRSESADTIFSAISKEEVEPISQFLSSKNVRLKNEIEAGMDVDVADLEGLSDDDDEELSIDSDDDDRGKKKSTKTAEKPKKRVEEDDDSGELQRSLLLM